MNITNNIYNTEYKFEHTYFSYNILTMFIYQINIMLNTAAVTNSPYVKVQSATEIMTKEFDGLRENRQKTVIWTVCRCTDDINRCL